MKFKNLTYRVQIFLAILVLVILTPIVLGIATANKTARQINDQYQDSLNMITEQINLNLNTLLSDAEKIGNLHLINDDIRRVMLTNYKGDMIKLAKDTTMMKTQISQANRLNPNVITSIFYNKYGYIFDYNFTTNKDLQETLSNISKWAVLARADDHYRYVGPIQYPKHTGNKYKNILPMVKILRDFNSNSEIGISYIGINFNTIANIIKSSKLPNSKMAFFSSENNLLFSSDEEYMASSSKASLIDTLSKISTKVNSKNLNHFEKINVKGTSYTVNAIYNITTGWKIVHFMDSTIIASAYRNNLRSFSLILIINILFGLLLALFVSRGLSSAINRLCEQIDRCEDGTSYLIELNHKFSNRELQKVIDSYNHLNQRLTESIKQNYAISLNEKQMKLQMLRSQINPHFLYNTLNIISSLANIHDVPEIRTIANSMSKLLRYNLKSGPIVYLKDELFQINRYITIQQIRFPNSFVYKFDVPEELYEIEIPTFILQPIIENSVGHGMYEKENLGYICISTYTERQDLHILITDNGIGIDQKKLYQIQLSLVSNIIYQTDSDTNSSIGIQNVHQRIQNYYGKEYGVTIESTVGCGTIVDIKLPLNKKPKIPPKI